MKVNFARPSLPYGIAVVCVTSGGKLTASAEKGDKQEEPSSGLSVKPV